MDMTDMLALSTSGSTGNPNEKYKGMFGQKQVGIYTIAFGPDTIDTTYSNGVPIGEALLRYMASVGDDGDRSTDPCRNVPYSTITPLSPQSCGNYYFAPDAAALTGIFEDIGKRIQTRISY
jgi:hypothetical protein